ncbi:flagellar hook-filament junction protein 1 [Azoarcus olearius]|uniref:flagellar hook-associated protein FlgK n=1 Tax=Azoarcus sp. (strain BH72) TaxID=418699 RepID=UPI00080619E9|nr:flagellar hook-associated protein FlgK [Azoarcus olearius]ANQ85894.1 flagellar hook-filament junction protein 1 [Azoarcus olearius]
MAGLLNIGLTGLNAAQAQLLTTGHNITNAGVEGYHRQTVIQTSNTPQFTGVGFFGQGTQVSAVTRSYSQYLENQVLTSSARLSEFTAYNSQISQINNLLADSTSGLSPVMEGFFAGVQEMASNPTSVAARQSLISSAQALVSRFQTMDARLAEIRQGTEGEIASTVTQINMFAGAIAEMNQRIAQAQVAGPSVAANDLLDQRDQLVAELNKLVKVNTVTENDGSMSVFMGSGQGLVVGGTVNQLAAVRDANDPQRSAIALMAENGAPTVLPENLLSGGTLGGLLGFRRESLDVAQNTLGLIAVGIAEAFNAQHQLGVDLDGVLGGQFFSLPDPALKPAITSATVSIENYAQLTAADYMLEWDGAAYSMRAVGGASIPLTLQVDGSYSGGGINIAISTPPPADFPTTGLLIQPTRNAAANIGVAITDPRKIAAGDPVSVAPGNYTGAVTDRIKGLKTLSVDGIDANADGKADFSPITLSFAANTFTASAGTIERYDTATGTWVAGGAYNPATDSTGVRFRVTDGTAPNEYAFEFTAVGAWASGESMVFSPTAAGVADNRNAVALGALQTAKTMLNGGSGATATFQSVYAQMVTQVGNKTREVQVNQAAQESLLTQATDARDALSGVNLDEEAANLVRYQMAYQSAARVMNVAQTLFDELLAIGR